MAKKIAIVLGIFVVCYLGAHFYIRWRNTVTDDVTKLSRLVECDPNEVKTVKITSEPSDPEKTVVFSRKDKPREGLNPAARLEASEWEMQSPLKGEADASALIRFTNMFCELYDPIPTKEDQFAPAPGPVQLISFTLEGGQAQGEHLLRFGGINGERMNVVKYSSPAGEEKVFLIQPKIFQLASQKPRDYLNMKIMRMSADNVMAAKVFARGKERFSLEREGDGWKVIAGAKALGTGSEEAAKFVNRLTTLRAIKVNEEALSPTACEPASSNISVELIGVGDRKEALYFQYGKTGPLSVCNSARESLFTVHRDLAPFIEADAKSLLR